MMEAKGPSMSLYTNEGRIGRGSFGSVFEYVLKEACEESSCCPMSMAVKMVGLEVREHVMCGFVHKNIVTFYGVETMRKTVCIKMEVAKCNLREFQDQVISAPFDGSDFLHLALQIMEGVEYLHEQGFAHRDIKPHNILVFWSEGSLDVRNRIACVVLKLCDFGLSRGVPDGSRASMTAVGTQGYLAPEVELALNKKSLFKGDFKKADIYSCGMVFFQLLLNRLPENEYGVSNSNYQFAYRELRQSVSERFAALLSLMLPLENKERISAKCVLDIIRPWNNETLLQNKTNEQQQQLKLIEYKLSELQTDSNRQRQQLQEMKSEKEIFQVQLKDMTQSQKTKTNKHNAKKVKNAKTFISDIHRAVHTGSISDVQRLISWGCDIKSMNSKGMTPLHSACEEGHLSIVQLLIESGAGANRPGKDGCIPLHLACLHGHLSIVELLLEIGAEIDTADKYGRTPLHSACINGHLAVAKVLFESNANISKADQMGMTPLHPACFNGHLPVVQFLLESGFDIDKPDNEGQTLLHFICRYGPISVARLLVEKGAAMNVRNGTGDTPLHLACLRGDLEIARLLLRNGADKNGTNNEGKTPLRSVDWTDEKFVELFNAF